MKRIAPAALNALTLALAQMSEVARFDDFSHLEVLEDGEHKATLARSAVKTLQGHPAGYMELAEEQRRIYYSGTCNDAPASHCASPVRTTPAPPIGTEISAPVMLAACADC